MSLFKVITKECHLFDCPKWPALHTVVQIDPFALEFYEGNLYAGNFNSIDNAIEIVRINPTNFNTTVVAKLSSEWQDASGASCIHENILYIVVSNASDTNWALAAIDLNKNHTINYIPLKQNAIISLLPPYT